MAIKYIPYTPLEGQAVLGNFVRTRRLLDYRGSNEVFNNIEQGIPLYEVYPIEHIGDNPNHNMVMRGDCVSTCAYLKDQGIEVDLVYIDPPFASGADYAKKIYLRHNPKVAEAIGNAEAELNHDDMKSFEEKMYGDIWDKERYLNWMYENLYAIKSIMKDTASIYVHLDWHIGHYVKVLMDEIFGEDNFKNEIIWGYRIQGVGKRIWARKHDTIYFYSKSKDDYIFETEKEDVIYERPFIDTSVKNPDMAGITERDIDCITNALKRKLPLNDRYKQLLFKKYYSNVYVRDVWDCDKTKPIISGSREYLDYATQKPEALLERIIKASTNEDKDMLVADFFAGSGVTAAVASKLGRKFITSDIGLNSIETTRDRLKGIGAQFDIMKIDDGVSLFRNPIQTMDKVKMFIKGLHDDSELNNFWAGSITDSKDGKIPTYVPDLKDSTARLLDKRMMTNLLIEELPKLPDGVKRVKIFYINAIEESELNELIKTYGNPKVKVELEPLRPMLAATIENDDAEWEGPREVQDGVFKVWRIDIQKFYSDRLKKKIEDYNINSQMQINRYNEKHPGNEKTINPLKISDEGLDTIEMISLDCTSADSVEWHADSEIKIDANNSYAIINGIKTTKFWEGYITSQSKPLRMKIRNICGDETVFVL